MRWLIVTLLLAALLAPPALGQTGNPTHDGLAAKGDVERRAELSQNLAGGGMACTAVIVSAFAGMDDARNAYWDMRCRDGNMYRATISAGRYAATLFLPCGAAAPAPRSGPCFQPITRADAGAATVVAQPAAAWQALYTSTPAQREVICRATCDTRPVNRVSACMSICLQGGDPDAPPIGSQPHMKYGAAYSTPSPLGAWGFLNGQADRLSVNRAAVASCQSMAGRVPCQFQAEFVNQCGALVQAVQRHPQAVVMTADPSTYVVSLAVTGSGETKEASESMAMSACERMQNTAGRRGIAAAGGPACRIVSSGC